MFCDVNPNLELNEGNDLTQAAIIIAIAPLVGSLSEYWIRERMVLCPHG
jgi:hypothetical protein